MVWGNLLTLFAINLISSAKSILPYNVTYSQVISGGEDQEVMIPGAKILHTTGQCTHVTLILEQLISSSRFEDKLESVFRFDQNTSSLG